MFSVRSIVVLLVVSLGLTFVSAAPVDSPVDADLEKRATCTPVQLQALNNAVNSQSQSFGFAIYQCTNTDYRGEGEHQASKPVSSIPLFHMMRFSNTLCPIAALETLLPTNPIHDTHNTLEN